jgi:hypothetical protein
MNPGAVFAQWLQAYEVDDQTVRTALATLRAVFRHVEVWQTNPGDLLLVCSQSPIEYDAGALRARIAREPFRSALAVTWHAWDLEGLLARYVAGPEAVEQYSLAGLMNTDDRNRIEFGFARTMGRRSGSAMTSLRSLAQACNAARPRIDGDVRWETVRDHRQLMYACASRVPPSLPSPTPVQKVRGAAFQCYVNGDLQGMVARWEARPYVHASAAEAAIFALAMARLDRDRARVAPLVQRVRGDMPLEAEVLDAVLDAQQGKTAQAADRLVAVFGRLRESPWILAQAAGDALAVAQGLSREDPSQAAKLHSALVEPFAGNVLAGARRLTVCQIGQALGPSQAVEAIAAFEPNVPWEEEFLVARQNAYEAVEHVLAAQAARDVDKFLRHARPDAPPRANAGPP